MLLYNILAFVTYGRDTFNKNKSYGGKKLKRRPRTTNNSHILFEKEDIFKSLRSSLLHV